MNLHPKDNTFKTYTHRTTPVDFADFIIQLFHSWLYDEFYCTDAIEPVGTPPIY